MIHCVIKCNAKNLHGFEKAAHHRLLHVLFIIVSTRCVVIAVHDLYTDVTLRQTCALFAWVKKKHSG